MFFVPFNEISAPLSRGFGPFFHLQTAPVVFGLKGALSCCKMQDLGSFLTLGSKFLTPIP